MAYREEGGAHRVGQSKLALVAVTILSAALMSGVLSAKSTAAPIHTSDARVVFGQRSTADTIPQHGTARTSPASKFSSVVYAQSGGTYSAKFSTKYVSSINVISSSSNQAMVKQVTGLLQSYRLPDQDALTLQLAPPGPVVIHVAATSDEYAKNLIAAGVSSDSANQLAADTAGYTIGNQVFVPMYQNVSSGDLANTLGHEVTEAILNQLFHDLPGWFLEGLAVYDGMRAQREVDGVSSYRQYARSMAETVLGAANAGQLLPLQGEASKVLANNLPYDLEQQDWLAISETVHQRGYKPIWTYFHLRLQGASHTEAFQKAFGESEESFNAGITAYLKSMAKRSGHTKDARRGSAKLNKVPSLRSLYAPVPLPPRMLPAYQSASATWINSLKQIH